MEKNSKLFNNCAISLEEVRNRLTATRGKVKENRRLSLCVISLVVEQDVANRRGQSPLTSHPYEINDFLNTLIEVKKSHMETQNFHKIKIKQKRSNVGSIPTSRI